MEVCHKFKGTITCRNITGQTGIVCQYKESGGYNYSHR